MRAHVFLFILISTKAFAQDTRVRPANAVYAEFLGTGIVSSVNYERTFANSDSRYISGKIGLGVSGIDYLNHGFTIPHALFVNFGKKYSYAEVGLTGIYGQTFYEEFVLGSTPTTTRVAKHTGYAVSPSIGYKFVKQRFVYFKVYACPIITVAGVPFDFEKRVTPWLGGSLGYAF